MATRQELVKEAEAKFQREQLLAEAEAKFASEQAPKGDAEAPLPEKIETGARSFLEGLSPFGISEPFISGINAGVSRLLDEGMSSKDIAQAVSDVMSVELVKAEYDKDVARRRELKQKLPELSTGAEMAGGLASVAIPAAGLGKTATALPSLAEKVATKVPTKLGKAVTTGAIVAAGEAKGREAVLEPTGFMKPDEALPALEAAQAGGTLGGALSAAGSVAKGLAKTPGRLLSAFGGVKASVIEDYLKRDKPLDPISVDDLKAVVDDAAFKIQAGIQSHRFATADLLSGAVKRLRGKISDDSTAGFAILDQEAQAAAKQGLKKIVPLQDIVTNIDKQIEEIAPGGVGIGPTEKAAVEKLQSLKKDFLASPLTQTGEVSLSDAKGILQTLDKITKYEKSAGTFTDELNLALQAIRGGINRSLRDMSPAYAQHMDQVAAETRLLADMDRFFGTPEKAIIGLKRLESGYDQTINNLTAKLESTTKFPIFQELNKIKKSASVESIRAETSQNFLKSVMRGNSIENRKKLALLSQMSGEDLMKMAQDTAMSEEFNKIVQNGSRDVVFWQTLLGGASGAIGGGLATESAAGSAVGGAIVGYLVKTYGAPTTKIILDGMIKVKGVPTVKKISAALGQIPPQVKDELLTGFVRANTIKLAQDPEREIQFDPELTGDLKIDVLGSDISALKKAQALDSLQKNGTMKQGILRDIMAGQERVKKKLDIKKKASDLAEDEVKK
jgi:hypothetical protein